MRIDVAGFLGANTQLDALMLGDGVGTSSLNQAPGHGDLRPWRQPLQVASVPTSTPRKTIYRMGRGTASDTASWLSWTAVVHAIRGFDREDTQERTYFTGAAGGPAWTDNTMAIATAPYPTASRPLGMPVPATAPALSIAAAGASTTTETRGYCYTSVNDLGWESGPSPIARITCNEDARITVGGMEAAPSGNYFINRRRIYRTETGTSGSTEFFLEQDLAMSDLAYTGANQSWTETTVGIVSQRMLPTMTALGGWLPCPSDATCLTQMWAGMAAVISGKTVRVCVANTLYAWPYDYEIPIADQPIAQGVWGQNLLVLTNGTKPVLISGTDPSSLVDSPIESLPFNGACQSVTSVVSLGDGVVWAAPDGLAYLGAKGQRILTAGLIHPDTWRAMKPTTMVCTSYLGLVFVFYDDGAGFKGFVIDSGSPSGIWYLAKGYQAAYADPLTGAMFVLDTDGGIKKWDAGAAMLTATFRSKEYRGPSTNLGYCRVLARAYPVTLRLVGDGVVKATKTVTSDKVTSLKGGYEANRWQVEVETAGNPITSAHVAQIPEELVP